jgi:hypothetical protein
MPVGRCFGSRLKRVFVMAQLEQRTVKHHLFVSERKLGQIAAHYGKDSSQYRDMLKHIGRLWAILRMTRSQSEFLSEVAPR